MKLIMPCSAGLVAGVVLAALAGATVAASAAPVRTSVSTYAPWSSAGRLHRSVVVAKTVTGSCWTGSIAVQTARAYRCTTGAFIYDPCFAPPGRHATSVVCAVSPWSDVVKLDLTSALPHVITPQKNPSLVWAERLVDGERCILDTGTGVTVAGTTLNYYCSPGVGWAGVPDITGAPWSASFVHSIHEKSVHRVAIVAAWY